MNWEDAMRLAERWAWQYRRRFRVRGKLFHDTAGLVPDEWIYVVEVAP